MLGLLPHAEPRPPDPDPVDREWPRPGHWRDAPPVNRFVNARARWTGHRFQGHFSSVVPDEVHPMLAARYVALNPVRAKLAQRPQDWAWSSLRVHLAGRNDALAGC